MEFFIHNFSVTQDSSVVEDNDCSPNEGATVFAADINFCYSLLLSTLTFLSLFSRLIIRPRIRGHRNDWRASLCSAPLEDDLGVSLQFGGGPGDR